MTDPVTALTRPARIACLSTERIQNAIDDILDMRLTGVSSAYTDPELAELWAELRRRQMTTGAPNG